VKAVEHIAGRPGWDCLTCGKPWPCDPAREQMRAEMDLVQRRVFLWSMLESAYDEGVAAVDLYERFMRWA
jgi:hypothetical protein